MAAHNGNSNGYENPETRLSTFHAADKSSPIYHMRQILTQDGFYATGKRNETKCYKCKGTYNNWKLDDDIVKVHRKIGPNCRVRHRGNLQTEQETKSPDALIVQEIRNEEPKRKHQTSDAKKENSADDAWFIPGGACASFNDEKLKEMGYTDEIIDKTVKKFKTDNGSEIPSDEDALLQIVLDYEDQCQSTILTPTSDIQPQTSQSQISRLPDIPARFPKSDDRPKVNLEDQCQSNTQTPATDIRPQISHSRSRVQRLSPRFPRSFDHPNFEHSIQRDSQQCSSLQQETSTPESFTTQKTILVSGKTPVTVGETDKQFGEGEEIKVKSTKEICCQQCSSKLGDLKILPCGHTICLNCRTRIMPNNYEKCPICNENLKEFEPVY